MLTGDSSSATVPSAGSVRITESSGASLGSLLVVTRNPASWSTMRASSSERPVTSGIAMVTTGTVVDGAGSLERLLSRRYAPSTTPAASRTAVRMKGSCEGWRGWPRRRR